MRWFKTDLFQVNFLLILCSELLPAFLSIDIEEEVIVKLVYVSILSNT